MALPARVTIWEAGARDGLQNEKEVVTTATKVDLINRLVEAGVRCIEAGSFVSPKWVPQMADSAEVMAGITRVPGVRYQALTPNAKGFEGAMAAKATDIAIFAAASEGFSRKNINCSIDESIDRFRPVAEAAKANGVPMRGFVSCVIACPFDGPIEPRQVARVTRALIDLGCYDVALGDTIGVGTPLKVKRMIEACASQVPLEKLSVHFHDTYGQALANTLAALEEGIASMDGSVAGLGGCPYAPGATGNVATEDLVYMLDGMGIETGIDLAALVKTAWFISEKLDRMPVSRVARALKNKL